MDISIPQRAANAETGASIINELIDAQARFLILEREQLEIPELKFKRIAVSELFAHIYSRH